ncbi:hypothetical protein U1Q18_025581 [Sarracenia purpurea var. burkii]
MWIEDATDREKHQEGRLDSSQPSLSPTPSLSSVSVPSAPERREEQGIAPSFFEELEEEDSGLVEISSKVEGSDAVNPKEEGIEAGGEEAISGEAIDTEIFGSSEIPPRVQKVIEREDEGSGEFNSGNSKGPGGAVGVEEPIVSSVDKSFSGMDGEAPEQGGSDPPSLHRVSQVFLTGEKPNVDLDSLHLDIVDVSKGSDSKNTMSQLVLLKAVALFRLRVVSLLV